MWRTLQHLALGKKAPTIAHKWLPLIAFGDRINHLARKSRPTHRSPHDGERPSWGATNKLPCWHWLLLHLGSRDTWPSLCTPLITTSPSMGMIPSHLFPDQKKGKKKNHPKTLTRQEGCRGDAGKVPSTPNSSTGLGKKCGNAGMSHGKQLSYRKQLATLLTNQKVPNPILVSQQKGCPPLPLQTPGELDHLLKHPSSAKAVQQTWPPNGSHRTQMPSRFGTRRIQSFCWSCIYVNLHTYILSPSRESSMFPSIKQLMERRTTLACASRKGKWTGWRPKQIVTDCTERLFFFPSTSIHARMEHGYKCKPRAHLLIKQTLCTCTTAINCMQNT